jgi:hypothetical protein
MNIQSDFTNQQYRDKYLSLGLLLTASCLVYPGQAFSQSDPGIAGGIDTQDSNIGFESTVLYSAIDTANMKPEFNRAGEPQPLVIGINQREYDEQYKTETIETILMPRQQIEFMANLEQGEVLLYSWQVDGKIYYDFHAHQQDVDPDIWIRYSDGAGTKNNGSIVAPYTGEHGWYWVNLDTRPVRLKLIVSGYYKDIVRIDL